MITIDIKDAKKIERGINQHNYLGWNEYAYNRAVVLPLDKETYIEHRKDMNFCSIKGKDYGYRGEVIVNCDCTDIEGIKYLRLITESTTIYARIKDEETNLDD